MAKRITHFTLIGLSIVLFSGCSWPSKTTVAIRVTDQKLNAPATEVEVSLAPFNRSLGGWKSYVGRTDQTGIAVGELHCIGRTWWWPTPISRHMAVVVGGGPDQECVALRFREGAEGGGGQYFVSVEQIGAKPKPRLKKLDYEPQN
jgi:hypothetical protein